MTNCIMEIEKQFNDIIISPSHDIVRIIGYAEDTYDRYIIVRDSNGKDYWMSMAILYFPLKNKIDDYDILDKSLDLNKCKKSQYFIFIDESDD